jgi:hypothetical protein
MAHVSMDADIGNGGEFNYRSKKNGISNLRMKHESYHNPDADRTRKPNGGDFTLLLDRGNNIDSGYSGGPAFESDYNRRSQRAFRP